MHDLLTVKRRLYPQDGAALTTNLVTFTGTGVVAVMNFGGPIEVKRMGIVVDYNANAALVVGAGFIIKLQKYLRAGDAAGALDLGTITRTATVAVGGIVYNDFDALPSQQTAEDGKKRDVSLRPAAAIIPLVNNFIVLPGQQLVWNITDAADTSGKGQVFVDYIDYPFVGANISAGIKVTV